ncbi:thymidylate synthase (FAD) [candidate division WOR-3 bacterium JGI_Cruoil_03_44_89]|uniref:Flavin-dependent thymidylate synthase n=1 Tax=candidate division WOR-3 bacterium JGI_Cruoil_03_44_89 TaxID=1973748 RepID=A0A235BW14_UNCW3|nr:MAG: thymidylate synthase (FAD) [candidate division WOR-3 bacterium JGI_Cruoil_03_44_89]
MEIELLSITPDAEKLIERAGRTSHLSFEREAENTEKSFIRMLIKKKHLSVLEHAYATFRIKGVSRALTHQLVRHRLCSYTQQSQRYVSESNFNYVEPQSIKDDTEAHPLFTEFMDKARETYCKLLKLGIKNEDARFTLPNAVCSEIVVTANLREWRHMIELRGSSGAQWEIREMALRVLRILKECVPTVFFDFEMDEKERVIRRK